MSKSLEPITIIASDLCEDMGDSVERHHVRIMKKLLDGYRELHLYISPELDVKSEIFPVSAQIELPCDFVYETKVGLLKNGVLMTLDLNRDLRMEKRKASDTQIQVDFDAYLEGVLVPTTGYPFFNVFRGNNFVGELYGFGCGYHANSWYNIVDGVLQLSSIVPDDGTEVVVEYKSNGLKDGFKLVPTEMIQALKEYAMWKFYFNKNPNLAEKYKVEYKAQYQRLKRLYSYRPPEYLAWLFKSGDRPSKM